MNYSEVFQFIEICPDVHVRGDIVRYPAEYRARVAKILSSSTGTAYQSLFLYDKTFPAHYLKEKKVAGYTGIYWAHETLIDLDDNEDPGHALVSAQNIVRKLEQGYLVEPEVIRIGFTGNRGFHISLPQSLVGFVPSPLLPRQMALFWKEICSDALHPTTIFDDKIYKGTGLIRTAGSYHKTAKRFKIMLTSPELLSFQGVSPLLEMAAARRPRPKYNNNPQRHDVLASLWPTETDAEPSSRNIKPHGSHQSALNRRPGGAIDESGRRKSARELLHMDLRDGEGRNNAAFRIACFHASCGISEEIVEWMMVTWNNNLSEPLDEYELLRTVRSALSRRRESARPGQRTTPSLGDPRY